MQLLIPSRRDLLRFGAQVGQLESQVQPLKAGLNQVESGIAKKVDDLE